MSKVIVDWFHRYLSDPEAIAIVLVIVGAIAIIKTMGHIFAPLIAGIIIAYLLYGVINKLEKMRCPHLLAVILVYTLFLGTLLLVLLWLLPLLWQEIINLFNALPGMVNHAQALLLTLQDRFPNIMWAEQLKQFALGLSSYAANFGKVIVTFSLTSLMNIVTITIYLVLVPLLVFFFLRDKTQILNWIRKLMPKKRRIIGQVWREVDSKIGNYIRGRIIEIILITIITASIFAVMGLNYAALLGALVGFSVVIPYIGMFVVTFPVVIVAFVQWGLSQHFFYILLSYALIALLDANVLVPMLFAEAMDLHPVAIILAVLIFGSLGGFWGVFFAIPLMTLANALFKAWPRS
jgi:putative permease